MIAVNTAAGREAPVLETVCGHCFAVNRVPLSRATGPAKCGRCSEPLLHGEPVALDDATFDRLVARDGLPVVVDFSAQWCAPCRVMAPAFEQAAHELKASHRFAKVDVDTAREVSRRFALMSIPTLVLFASGREVQRTSGAMSASQIVTWLAQAG